MPYQIYTNVELSNIMLLGIYFHTLLKVDYKSAQVTYLIDIKIDIYTYILHFWQKRLLHPGMMCLFVIISISSVREV